MTNMVSLKQSKAVAAALDINACWEEVPASAAQMIIEDPITAGREYTRFLQNGGRMIIVTTDGIALPPGARMHIVTVMVDESRPWDEAVNAAGPNTGADWNIRKVGDQYPPTLGATPKMRVIYLVNFGKDTMGDDNIAWGKSQKLRPETPRAVFAVTEHNSDLDEVFGMEGCMAVTSLEECSFGGSRRAPSAWWDGTERKAGLGNFGNAWDGSAWFAFSREEFLKL